MGTEGLCARVCACVCEKNKMLAFDKAHVIVPDRLRQIGFIKPSLQKSESRH